MNGGGQIAAFVVMFLWAALTLGVVEQELHRRHARRARSMPAAPPIAAAPAAASAKPADILICPITLEVMRDPVATSDGQASGHGSSSPPQPYRTLP